MREIAGSFTVLRDGQSVATGEIHSASDDQLIAHMVGRAIQNLFPSRTMAQTHETIFEAQNLSATPLLRDASFELRRGEILGVAGLMGSGRTQVVRTIFGLDRAESGTINLQGKSVVASGGTPAVRLFQKLGYLSEDRKGEGLAINLSIADNVTMTRFSSCARWGWLNLSQQKRQAEQVTGTLAVKAR